MPFFYKLESFSLSEKEDPFSFFKRERGSLMLRFQVFFPKKVQHEEKRREKIRLIKVRPLRVKKGREIIKNLLRIIMGQVGFEPT